MRTSLVLVFILGAGLVAPCFADDAELSEAAQQGRRLYEFHCQSCHGETGHGDGPTAEVLTVKPVDLTKLAKKNHGEFPLERVARSIDGRNRTPAHGSAMPIWGLDFQDPTSDVYQEGEVKRRIDDLIAYLRTIQK